ncbi:MAG: hypothetical protein IJ733_05675 [Lachnospiraceae bacterium]|nr:hypothetical protein [Lachnospiraceae bacterium]
MERKKWVAFLLVCTLLVLQFNTNVEAQNMLGESTENIVRYKDNEKRAEKDYSSGILCSVQGGLPKEIVQNGFKYYFNYDDSENLIKMSIGKKEIFHAAYSDDNLCKITYDNGNVIEYHYDENGNMLFNSINGNPAYQWVYEDGDVCKIIDFRYGHVYNMSQSENDSDIKKYAVDNKFSMTQCEDDDKTVTEYRVGTERKKTTKYYGANDERRIGKLIDHSKNIVEVKDNRKKYIISNGSDNIIEMNAYKSGGGISELAFGDGSKFEYKYKDGNIVSVSENDRLICSYVYDRENRLIRENNCRTGKTYIYEYGAGNNLSKVCEYNYLEEDKLNENGLLDVCNYDYGDEWSDLLTEFDRQEIQYDKIGNPLVYRDGMRLQWSFGRQLTEVHSGANFITYQYDYDGNRIAKNVNGRKTSYYYDDSNLVYQFDEEHEIWYIYDVDGYVAGFVLDGDSYYYKKNVTDDVVGIYDDEKNLVAEYIYDAWGKVINILGDKSVAEANPIRYKSYYYDTETGFYYLMNRYYDVCLYFLPELIYICDEQSCDECGFFW